MTEGARLGARSRALLTAAAVLALAAVGQIPAFAAPPPPTNVVIQDGGDDFVNAAEVTSGIVVTGNYDLTAVPPIDRVAVRLFSSPTCAAAVPATIQKTIPVAGGTFSATFTSAETAVLSEGVGICARARAQDTSNAFSAVTFSTNRPVKDTVAPADPTVAFSTDPINAANATAVGVGGASEADGTVEIELSNGASTATDTVTVPPSGSYSATFDLVAAGIPDGTVLAEVRGYDEAGNPSANVATDSALKDTGVPAAPGLTISPTLITSANVASFKATLTGEVGTTAHLVADDTVGAIPPVLVNVPLSASPLDVPINIASLADGAISVSATLEDAAGNVSPATVQGATKDTTAPPAPIIVTPAENQLVKAFFTVVGAAEPFSTVEVFDVTDGTQPPVSLGKDQTDKHGSWSVPVIVAKSGTKILKAQASDAVGNLSPLSAPRLIDVDAGTPKVTIDSPAHLTPYLPGEQVLIEGTASDDKSGVLAIDLQIFDMFGQRVAFADIKNLTCTLGCPIKKGVTWSYRPSLGSGTYTFKAWAIDLAGNRTPQPTQIGIIKLG